MRPDDTTNTRADGSLEFMLQLIPGIAGRNEKVAVQTLEVAVDALLRGDGLDPVHGGPMALGHDAGALLPVHVLDPVIPVIDHRREMSRGPRGLAPGHGPAV